MKRRRKKSIRFSKEKKLSKMNCQNKFAKNKSNKETFFLCIFYSIQCTEAIGRPVTNILRRWSPMAAYIIMHCTRVCSYSMLHIAEDWYQPRSKHRTWRISASTGTWRKWANRYWLLGMNTDIHWQIGSGKSGKRRCILTGITAVINEAV